MPTFTRAGPDHPLFYLVPEGGFSPPTGYAVAFLPDAGTGALPDSLSLEATWTTSPGLYLFLGAPVADEPTFTSAVRAFVGKRAVRFLWIANPAAPSNQWSAALIEVQLPAGSRQGTVGRLAQLTFRNFLLAIPGGAALALNEASDGFVVTPQDGSPAYWQVGSGASRLAASGTLRLPFSGADTGCVGFDLPVRDTGTPAGSDLDALDAGCRYFVDATPWPTTGFLTSFRYPVLTLASGPLTLHAAVDPVNPLVPERTCFRFLAAPGDPGTAIASGFRTVFGQAVTLTPTPSAQAPRGPGLVFNVRPSATTPTPEDPLYLTFEGTFTLALPSQRPGEMSLLMCGISGVEYARLPATGGAQLHFFSGQPAYAPRFSRSGPAAPETTAEAPPLSAVATTSWAFLTPPSGGELRYFAQPQDSVLYQATPDPVPRDDGTAEDFLYYLEVFAGTFPATIVPPPAPEGTRTAIPLVPYAHVDPAALDDLRALELQVLSPHRRNLLTGLLAPTETGPRTGQRAGATPQGLLLTFDQELRYWETLTLARHAGGQQLLQLANVTGGLKSALQSNQLFAVVSNRDVLARAASPVGAFGLTLDGWGFSLSPSRWSGPDTLMLLKYTGRSIQDLASDPGAWSWREAANGYSDTDGNLPTTQAALQAFIADALERALTEPDFRPIADVLTNPSWNGVLFLRAPLSPGAFPAELQGLSAGVDPAALVAHHLGFNVTPIHNVAGQLTQEDTSIFGLIHYEDRQDLFETGSDYGYKVLSLKVLFQNSTVTNFFSQVELMVNALFGEGASLPDSGRGNNLVLNGYYQRQGAGRSYVFTQQGSNVFRMTSDVLAEVETTAAQFVTLLPEGGGPSDTVRTRFLLAGNLRFKAPPDFDVFSFGPVLTPDGGTVLAPGQLAFSGLAIDMTFPQATPRETSFTFNAGAVALDASRSQARADSFYNHFPLRLGGLLQAPPDTSPGGLGYISVGSPLVQGAPTFPWYALQFDLDLGTLGALAGDVGLAATLVAAWGPGDDGTVVYVGLKLPGSNSASAEIPIEGVLKLGFKGIDISVDRSDGTPRYLLRFRSFALRLLSLSFPPGQLDLVLFGDPSQVRGTVLGWYAAYAKDEKDGSKAGALPSSRALARPASPARKELP